MTDLWLVVVVPAYGLLCYCAGVIQGRRQVRLIDGCQEAPDA